MATSATGSQIGGVFVRVGADTTGLNRGLREATARINDFDRQAQMATRSIASLGARFAAAFSAVKIIDIADNWGQVASRIKQATNSQEEYNLVQSRLVQSANSTYRSLQESQELFIQTSQSIRSLGYSLEQSIDLTDSFSALLVTNAASADRGRAAIDAYSKAIQTGRVDSQTWQTILSAMPTIIDAISKSSGKSAEEIRKLGIEGKLALNEINTALLETLDDNMRKVGEMPTTVRDALQRVSNNFQNLIGIQNEASGATAALVSGIDFLADHIETLAKIAGGVAVTALAAYIGRMGASTVATVAAYQAKRVATAEEIRLSQAQLVQARATMAQIAATNAADVSTRKLTAAKIALELAEKRVTAAQAAQVTVGRSLAALFGGPAGFITLAAVAATSLIAFGRGGDQAKQSIEALTERVDAFNSEASKLTQNQARQAMLDLQSPLDEAKSRVQLLEDNIAGLSQEMKRIPPGSPLLAEFEQALIRARGDLDTASSAVERLTGRMSELKAVASAAGAATAGAAASLSAEFLKQEAIIKKQIALMGVSGQAASLRYDLEHGELSKLTDAEREKLKVQIDALDVAEKRYEQQKKAAAQGKKDEASGKRDAEKEKTRIEKLKEELKQIQKYAGEGTQVEVAEALERQTKLAEIFKNGQVDRGEYYSLLEQLANKHAENMAKIAEADAQQDLDRNQKLYEGRLIGYQDYLSNQMRISAEQQAALTEIEIQGYVERLAAIDELYGDRQDTEDERRIAELRLAEEHQERLTDIDAAAAAARIKIAEQERAKRVSVMDGMLGNLASLMDSGNKKMFQIGKIAAISRAVLSGYEAVTQAYRVGTEIGGPPLGAAFAATAAAATAAQIASIKNTQYGGGGSPSSGYSKPSDATASGPQPAGAQQQAQSPAVTINIGDGLYSGKAVRDLISAINEAVGDGARLRVA
ncbi:tape measure protein [Bordetella genomosp. 4]|uniref:Tape measure protein N-terminal domain-containing protein n=1 Tax=Bordetella genomosp. 4 TaxID=463044 RepID=A0A261U5H5_9BORD|nr:tape measure protein [Bordetella genomosp. 4]OZI56737.1 hypothetical protein CAL20_15155 [Bordetella genomosp. 4]